MKTSKIILQFALKTFSLIVGFYFVMKLIGLADVLEFRIFNIVFVLWGVNSAIKTNLEKNLDNTYLTNLYIGFSTSALTVISTIVAMITYVTFVDQHLLVLLETASMWGSGLTLPKVVFAMTIEGMASSVISSFLIMQYWKKHKINSLVRP